MANIGLIKKTLRSFWFNKVSRDDNRYPINYGKILANETDFNHLPGDLINLIFCK